MYSGARLRSISLMGDKDWLGEHPARLFRTGVYRLALLAEMGRRQQDRNTEIQRKKQVGGGVFIFFTILRLRESGDSL